MSYEDRLTSPGPARDDPELGDTAQPYEQPSGGPEGPSANERAREAATAGREQAQKVAGTAGEQTRRVADTARGEATQVARTAEDQARRLASEARDELRAQAGTQMTRLAEGIEDVSRQLRSMGERGDPGPATDMVGEAARYTGRMAERLRRGGPDDALDQMRRMGRNRPGLFLLGAFGMGLVAGRVARNLDQEGAGRTPGPVRATYEPGDGAAAAGPGWTSTGTTFADTGSHAAYGAPVEAGYEGDPAIPPGRRTPPVPPRDASAGERRWGA